MLWGILVHWEEDPWVRMLMEGALGLDDDGGDETSGKGDEAPDDTMGGPVRSLEEEEGADPDGWDREWEGE